MGVYSMGLQVGVAQVQGAGCLHAENGPINVSLRRGMRWWTRWDQRAASVAVSASKASPARSNLVGEGLGHVFTVVSAAKVPYTPTPNP